MTQTTALTEQKLIENLVVLRSQFITANIESIKLHKKAIEISRKINDSIPTINAGYLDDFDTVFYSISAALGENTRQRVRPKDASIMLLSDNDICKLTTKKVDGRLWDVLFNRLGLYKSMSEKQKSDFRRDCCENPMTFTIDVITDTLSNLIVNQESIMLDGLYDTFSSLKSTYVSNDVRMFGKKVVIDNAFLEYGESFKLTTHDKLQSLIEVVWRWILVNKWEMTEVGVNANQIWDDVSKQLEDSEQDYEQIRSIESFSIEFRFFKNKNVHVLFPNSMIAMLNSQLAKKNYIASK